MTTLESTTQAAPPLDRQNVRAAIDRGDIVRLLAEVDAGRLNPDVFLALLDEREKRDWLRRAILTLFMCTR